MENEALTRRLRCLCQLMSFGYGTLWIVGENLWKDELIPKGYDSESTRIAHPGICIQESGADAGLHATVPMWYGTSNKKSTSYQIYNFFNIAGDESHITYFGHYQAVPIGLEHVGARSVIDSDFSEVRKELEGGTKAKLDKIAKQRQDKLKGLLLANEGRKELRPGEKQELRAFIRKNLAIVWEKA